MPLPGDLTTVTVTGTFGDPSTGAPYSGYVTFTPSTTLTDSTGHIIMPAAGVQATLTNGVISKPLLATDNANVQPAGWTWQVSFNLQGVQIPPWSFQLPSNLGPTVDLSALTQVVPQPAVTTYLQAPLNLADLGNKTLARANLSAAKSGANSDITSLLGLTTPLPVNEGGTGTNVQTFISTTIVPAPTGVQATDAANITAAITAAGAGGTLYFQYTGTSYVADQLAPLAMQTWTGKATIQRPNGSTNSVIACTGVSNWTMRDLIVDGNASNSTATSNAAIYVTNGSWVRLHNVTVQNCPAGNSAVIFRGTIRGLIDACQFFNVGYGVSLGLMHGDAYASYGNVIRGCFIDTTTNDAIFITENLGSNAVAVVGSVFGTVIQGCTVRNFGDCGVEVGSGSVGTTVTGCTFQGISNANGNQGVLCRDAAHVTISNCTVSNLTKTGSNGVYIIDLNGNCTDININNVDVTNCGYGILAIGGTSPSAIGAAHKGINISGGTIDTTTADGIQLTNVSRFSITGTDVYNAGNQGISIGKFNTANSGSVNGTISTCTIMNSSQATAGSFGGIEIFQNSADVTITACRIGDDQGTKTQGYGIRIFDSTVSNIKISGCDLTNGGTVANFSNAAGTTQGIEVYRCTGISPVGLRTAITRDDNEPDAADHGLISWSYPARMATISSGVPVNGCLYLVAETPRNAFTTTKTYFSWASAGSGPTAGQNWIGWYDMATGTLRASVEISSLIGGTAGEQSPSWSASYSGPGGYYWKAYLFNCTTPPTMYRMPGAADNATFNAGIGTAANYMYCHNGSGLTALPSSLTLSANSISSSPDAPRVFWGATG